MFVGFLFYRKIQQCLFFTLLVSATIFLITALASQSLNPNGTRLYWLSPYPLTCRTDQDVPCRRGAIASFLNIIFGVILILCILANVFILLNIYVSVRRQERRADLSRIRRVSVRLSNRVNSNRTSRTAENDSSSARVFLTQATYYAFAFLICYTPAIIVQSMKVAGSSSIPFALQQLSRTIRPLQGTLNVLIFTRPRVRGLREKYEISYFAALKRVILSGCDNINLQNTLTPRPRPRKSTLKQPCEPSWKDAISNAAISKATLKCTMAQSTKHESSSKSRSMHVEDTNKNDSIRFQDLNDIHLEKSVVSEHNYGLSADTLKQSSINDDAMEEEHNFGLSDDKLAIDTPVEQRNDIEDDANRQKRTRGVSFSADDLVIQNDLDYIEDTFGNEV